MLNLDHGEEATQYLRKTIGDGYLYSNEPVFPALWESYNECQFVEDEGKCYLVFCIKMHTYNLKQGIFYFIRTRKENKRRISALHK